MSRIGLRFGGDSIRGPAALALVAAFLLAGLTTVSGAQRTSNKEVLPVLSVRVAAQDRHAYVSWNDLPGSRYTLRWRERGKDDWANQRSEKTTAVIKDLLNDSEYEIQVVALTDEGRTVTGAVTRVVPRIRTECNAGALGFFCSVDAIKLYLQQFSASAFLQCGDRIIDDLEIDIPNCWYRSTIGHVVLSRFFDQSYVPPATHLGIEAIRSIARHALWPTGSPFQNGTALGLQVADRASTGLVDRAAFDSASSLVVEVTNSVRSRVTWFKPAQPVAGLYALYYEGHGLEGAVDAHDMVEWLLARGWQVITVDQPLMGANAADVVAPLLEHEDFRFLEGHNLLPLGPFLLPLKALVDTVVAEAYTNGVSAPEIALIGRSGGGAMGAVYSMLDPRITVNVNIAGGAPETMVYETEKATQGDFEQYYAPLLDVLPRDVQLLAGGTRGSFFYYSTQDPCCFRMGADDAWITYLSGASAAWSKVVKVALDNAPIHGFSANGFAQLDTFLQGLGLGHRPLHTSQPVAAPPSRVP